jgi:hypothetical protein
MMFALAACGSDDKPVFPDAAPAADADLTVDAAPPRESIIATQPLQPGELIEGVMRGGPNDLALIHLEAPLAKLGWNIHAHPGGSTITVYEEDGKMVVDYAFVPSTQGEWFLLLHNGGLTNMDVKVNVGLYGGVTWEWL